MAEFTEWITRKYSDWQPPRKTHKSVSLFAKYVGVRQRHMAKMLSGQIKTPEHETLVLLAERLGGEVFDFFRPDLPERRVVAEPLVIYRAIDLRRDKIIQRIKIAPGDKLAQIEKLIEIVLGKE